MSSFPCLVRSVSPSGEARYALGDPLVDSYLEFVAGRCRPNTLRAVALDLKTFFTVVDKDPVEVAAGGRVRVPGPSARRPHGGPYGRSRVGPVGAHDRSTAVVGVGLLRVSGRPRRHAGDGEPGAAWLVDTPGGWPGPDGAVGAGAADVAEDPVAGRGRRAARRRCARTGTGRWCWRCCSAGCAAARCSGCGCATCASLTGRCSSPTARAAINGWCRSPTRSSPRSVTTCATNAQPDVDTDRVFVVLKRPRRGRPLTPKGSMRSSPAPARRAGLERGTCHQLRHTCLTRLREAGMALEAVQAQAGHRSIESTRIYLHLTNDWLAGEYRRASELHRRRHRAELSPSRR